MYDLNSSGCIPESFSEEQHISLLTNEEFKICVKVRTTDVENIHKRIEIAKEYLGAVHNEN